MTSKQILHHINVINDRIVFYYLQQEKATECLMDVQDLLAQLSRHIKKDSDDEDA